MTARRRDCTGQHRPPTAHPARKVADRGREAEQRTDQDGGEARQGHRRQLHLVERVGQRKSGAASGGSEADEQQDPDDRNQHAGGDALPTLLGVSTRSASVGGAACSTVSRLTPVLPQERDRALASCEA